MTNLPRPVTELRRLISRMPGFSERGAERFLEWWWSRDEYKKELFENWGEFLKFKPCKKCFLFASGELCDICQDKKRVVSKICVVSSPFTVGIIEKDVGYEGVYFVLGGDVVGIRNTKLIEEIKKKVACLKKRVLEENIKEVTIATDFTSKGEATALFIKDALKETGAEINRLASGFHPGDSLGYSDPVTLKRAFENRTKI